MSLFEWVAVVVVGLLVYSVGFVAAVAVISRTCSSWSHSSCNHVWGTPLPLLWPFVAAMGVAVSPLALPLYMVSRVSFKVDRRIIARREVDR